jgi:hypothetical protein
MADCGFRLGNFNVDEILFGAAQNFNGDLLYTLDQLSSAQIEISAESTDITDKKGNVVRTVYTSKTGTFTATNAFLHPAIMNAASGSDIEVASATAPIQMPKIEVVKAGETLDIKDAIADSIKVIGLYGNGANSNPLTLGATAEFDGNDGTYAISDDVLEVPASADCAPVQYFVKYERNKDSGIKLTNTTDKFPNTVRLTLYCSYVDPFSDTLKPMYVVLPSVMADPSTTISLDRETQEMDFNGNIQMDYCGAEKVLYILYFPDEEIVSSGTTSI